VPLLHAADGKMARFIRMALRKIFPSKANVCYLKSLSVFTNPKVGRDA
jgi:hypothetical protein